MNVLTRKIPDYYYEKSNLIRLVLFTAFFDLIFINIYKPFSSLTWYPVSEFKFFLFSSLVILTGLLTVAISRVIMYFLHEEACSQLHRVRDLDCVGNLFFIDFLHGLLLCFTTREGGDGNFLGGFRKHVTNPFIALRYFNALFLLAG